ncbi:GFA family protein [Gammaproteobacteria bacterium]|nr:GFA family protein [Gammaproteobacteria bacterium]
MPDTRPLLPSGSYHLSCHCQRVRITIRLREALDDPHRCDCSLCRRRGAATSAVAIEDLTIESGASDLRRYTFNTHEAEHFFCSHCGIYTHHRRRSNANQFGFNLGCIEDIDVRDLQGLPLYDGVHHPSDHE